MAESIDVAGCTGSVYQRHGGGWRIDYYEMRPLGSVRVRRDYPTKDRALDELGRRLRLEAAVRDGSVRRHVAPARSLAIDALSREYLAEREAVGRRPATLARYRASLAVLGRYLGASLITDITPRAWDRYVRLRRSTPMSTITPDAWHKGHSEPASPATINRDLAALRQLVRWCLRRRIIVDDPLAGVQAIEERRATRRKVRRALSDHEVAKLRLVRAPWGLVFRFGMDAGLRANEIATLTWSDVDEDLAGVTVRPEVGKTGGRWVPLSPSLRPLLAPQAHPDRNPGQPVCRIAGRALRPGSMRQALRRECVRLGIDTTGLDFHALRHTFCTRALRSGVPRATVAALVGHRDISTALAHYWHPEPGALQAAVASMDAAPTPGSRSRAV